MLMPFTYSVTNAEPVEVFNGSITAGSQGLNRGFVSTAGGTDTSYTAIGSLSTVTDNLNGALDVLVWDSTNHELYIQEPSLTTLSSIEIDGTSYEFTFQFNTNVFSPTSTFYSLYQFNSAGSLFTNGVTYTVRVFE
jgi:hypothetical protein